MENEEPTTPDPFKKPPLAKVIAAALQPYGLLPARFLNLLPALLAGLLCLRLAELAAWLTGGGSIVNAASVTPDAAGLDLLCLARYLFVLFVFSLPLLRETGRPRPWLRLGLLWSLLLFVQTALVEYFFNSGLPLGSDLFGYAFKEIVTTIQGGGPLRLPPLAGLAAALAVLWFLLPRLWRRERLFVPGLRALGLLAASAVCLLALPQQPANRGSQKEYQHTLALNKTCYFIDETFVYFTPAWFKNLTVKPVSGAVFYDFKYLDPKYPFLHAEQTPDALGPYFKRTSTGRPPNLVFIIVEGLGRAFSGPDAALGSFTPRLDRKAENSLYWTNFLAPQGRTFGVLPTLLGSLPFGPNGFAELGEAMPPHVTLLSLLKQQGYRLKVYCGFDADFDNDRIFYQRNGVDSVTDELNFGAGYQKSNIWGYADGELFRRILEGEAKDGKQPFLAVIKTSTMHTPYTFNGQQAYAQPFERHLDQLAIPAEKKDAYRAQLPIYTSTLYLDDELDDFLNAYAKLPAYRDTIFIITGDHRLPEIPLGTRIDRYHVPLLVFSPLLKAPARIKSVSSQFDVAPSLLAYLAKGYGFNTPKAVTWLGSGLDMEPAFRNTHYIPIKQTKTNLVDYVSGSWYINQDTLYRLGDNMYSEPVRDDAVLKRMRGRMRAFSLANDRVKETGLMPLPASDDLAPYAEAGRVPPVTISDQAEPEGVYVRDLTSPERAKPGALHVEMTFSNNADSPSAPFIPLVVLMTPDTKELSETYGKLMQLPAGGKAPAALDIKCDGVKPGIYYLAVIPSDPDNGKSIGTGRYKIQVKFE